MSALWRAYLGWRETAGPLADFVLPTPFLAEWSPTLTAVGSDHPPRHALGRRVAAGLLRHEAGTLVFLEAAPRLALAATAQLRRHAWQVAPAFGRWPVPGAVLPVEPLTEWLVGALNEGDDDADGPPSAGGDARAETPLCVLLDAERRRPVSAQTLRRRFDNRYDYGPQMLPPPTRLRGWGVTRVVWAGPAAALAPDLQDYAASLVDAGFPVELVRLADVMGRT